MVSGQKVTESKTVQYWKWHDSPHLDKQKHTNKIWASGGAVPPYFFGEESNLKLSCFAEDNTRLS